ncbi:hypothetical protein KL929_002982 [Ogataea haglerorum]|uniref:uncharacterized protein n=1 Tax=Ogataea haglerorum TaxID=1937702 RepID=UPI001C89E2F9|nr:uncharacterized protein KL911_002990 [Ogataea haglerorum]KAG7747217.1 hypothetical protein KL912_003241 [Ogataea haglerorum]KAG7752885.1 hypothetical protein KL911_002990 [Ogataea haglerorum]KAG7796475.1 hypothetical protein KL929_002982 [Ogataea haglerorum]
MFLQNLRGTKLSIAIALAGASAWILQGYDQAIMNGLLTMKTFEKQFPTLNTNRPGVNKQHATVIEGTVVAIYELGCVLGCVASYFYGDKLGRRRFTMMVCTITIIGVIIQTSSFHITQLVIARVITGVGVGGITATVPTYISECAPARLRGKLVLLCGSLAISGVALATWVDFGFYFVKHNSVNWRFPIALQMLFPTICISLVLFLPDSPRWLVKVGRTGEAAEVFARLEDKPVDSDQVQGEISMIQQSLMEDPAAIKASPFSRTKNKHLRRSLMAIGLNIGAQMTGINIVTFYSTSIFEQQLGYSSVEARIFSGSIQIWQAICAFAAIFLIDIFGRRFAMIHAAAIMGVCQFILGGLASDLQNKATAKAMIAFYFVAMYAFPVGLLLVVFMYAAEIAPLESRAQITAISTACNWLFNFVVAEASPTAFNNIGYKYYFVYGSVSFVLLVCLILFYPETRDRSLEEIDDIFIQSQTLFDTVRIAKTMPVLGDAEFDPERKLSLETKDAVEYVE